MKLEMNKNSIFAVLMRSPWWISMAVALAMFMAARLLLPAAYTLYASFFALPFLVIGVVTGWKQLRAPSEAAVTARLEVLRSMSWKNFSAAVQEALARESQSVKRIHAAGADFEITQGVRVVLVSCKRWKAANTGIEPLRELHTARIAHEAHQCIYIATGTFSENAVKFAEQQNIRLIRDAELAAFLPAGK